MKGHGEKLTRKQEEAITALLTAPSLEAAAHAIGVGAKTLYRWRQLDDFNDAYRAARRQFVQQATSRLATSCAEAVDILNIIMRDAAIPPANRIAAAKATIDITRRLVEQEDLTTRVARLDKIVKENNW